MLPPPAGEEEETMSWLRQKREMKVEERQAPAATPHHLPSAA